jgi:hypothetical protein
VPKTAAEQDKAIRAVAEIELEQLEAHQGDEVEVTRLTSQMTTTN